MHHVGCMAAQTLTIKINKKGDHPMKRARRIRLTLFVTYLSLVIGHFSFLTAFSDEFKVGYIDSEVIFQKYQGSVELKKQLEEEMKEWEKILREKRAKIEEFQKEYESQKLMLSDEAKERKEQDLKSLQREYESTVQEIFGQDGKARKREKELTQPLLEKIHRILDRLSEEEGFKIIFDMAEGGIVYGSPALDLTERILEELNKEFTPLIAEVKRKEIYVFPLRETTPLAKEEGVGITVTSQLEQALLKSPTLERARGDVGSAMIDAGVVKADEITLPQALQVGKNANVAIEVMGTVSKMGPTIEVSVDLVDVLKGTVIATEKEVTEGDREQEIAEMVNTLARKLLKKVQ